MSFRPANVVNKKDRLFVKLLKKATSKAQNVRDRQIKLLDIVSIEILRFSGHYFPPACHDFPPSLLLVVKRMLRFILLLISSLRLNSIIILMNSMNATHNETKRIHTCLKSSRKGVPGQLGKLHGSWLGGMRRLPIMTPYLIAVVPVRLTMMKKQKMGK